MGGVTESMKRRRDAAALLSPGRIVYVPTPDADYDKFLIIVAFNPSLLGFYINSRIHPFIAVRPALNRCQVTIAAENHRPYLRDDSYADCSKVITCVTRVSVITHAAADPSRIKKLITADERTRIVQAVRDAYTISKDCKTVILSNLK
jgi:hypothetical protein